MLVRGGLFRYPCARIVGPKGKVYGVDGNPSAISALQEQAEKEGLKNLFLTAGAAEDIVVCEHGADFVFFGISSMISKTPPKPCPTPAA